MIDHSDNPFLSRAKSNDLRNEEIQHLWIDYGDYPQQPGFDPKSPMATIVLGGKGSGKTHLFRYFSFPVQGLRYAGDEWKESISDDGYVGVYARADGLNGSRFSGKGINDEEWREVFRQYMELWLADGFLRVLASLACHVREIKKRESDIVSLFWDCLDSSADPKQTNTLDDFHKYLITCRRHLDRSVNIAAFERAINPQTVCASGGLIFGLPRILAESVPAMRNILFSYYIDECENLLTYQQRYVNTLVRERSEPTTFRIGARSYGMRTFQTDSGDREEIRDGSEFNLLQLDAHYRKVPRKYKEFARQLLARRLEAASGNQVFAPTVDIDKWFSPRQNLVLRAGQTEDRHIAKLRDQLSKIFPDLVASDIVEKLRCPTNIVVEKAAIFQFYQSVAKGRSDLQSVAADVAAQVRGVVNGERNKLSSVVEHYKGDFLAQIRSDRRQGRSADYVGLDDFIIMSEGLPRVLLTMVGNIVSCASFRGETPIGVSSISADSQRQGVLDSAERFHFDIPRASENSDLIRRSISRLGELFRLNRFADKPIECSLIGFSVRLDSLSTRAQEVIEEAEQRSFLLRGIQNDRSSKQVWDKFYLNRLLCPKYDLGIAVRGLARFRKEFADAVFGIEEDEPYEEFRRHWIARMNWPFRARISFHSRDIF